MRHVVGLAKTDYHENMCGRFALGLPAKLLAALMGLEEPEDWEPRYNIAPSQMVLAARTPVPSSTTSRVWFRPQWGLVPGWARGRGDVKPLINARSETVAEKPSFRQAFRERRCLIPATGFYEWQKVGRCRHPFWFHRRDRRPFAFAGLWEPGPEGATTCTLLTTAANAVVAPVHDRMPVMLTEAAFDLWLGGPVSTVQELLIPFAADDLVAERVSARVNSTAVDDETCIQPDRNLLEYLT